MLTSRNPERQWKNSVEEALAHEKLGVERGRLTADLARRIWLAHGGQAWAEASSEGTLLALETLIGPSLDEGLVRSSAALRYLGVLEETARSADYEDTACLRQELRWAGNRLRPLLEGLPEAGAEKSPRLGPGSYGTALGHLHEAIFQRLSATLKAAEIAA